ncbi:hypothetical protein B0H12DRAFT_1134383 [Mycena haematopus]|nr:hypothetical protein B0H12DRAFT_1134383 [Mycena haematopus]
MSTPNVAPRQSFPIAAAVVGGMVVVLFAAIIAVLSCSQKERRNRKPIGYVETAEGRVNPRGALKIHALDSEQTLKVVVPDRYSGLRADGSTIYVSSPSVE